jgi:Zn-dependent protease
VVPSNFTRGRRSQVYVAGAGVTANFLLALVLTLVAIVLVYAERASPGNAWLGYLKLMAEVGISLNFLLVVFNLLPLPPLDGWTVMQNLLPVRIAQATQRLHNVAIIVFFLMFFTGSFGFVLAPARMLEHLSKMFILWST